MGQGIAWRWTGLDRSPSWLLCVVFIITGFAKRFLARIPNCCVHCIGIEEKRGQHRRNESMCGNQPVNARMCGFSMWLQARYTDLVENRIEEAIKAFSMRDFGALGEIIMQESDDLHAICAAAEPYIVYLSNQSQFIIKLVRAINSFMKQTIVEVTKHHKA